MLTPSVSLNDSIVQRLSMASLAVRDCRNRLYRDRYNLSIAGWQILVRLHEQGPAVQRQICLWNRTDKVTVSRAVIRLVRRNLLMRINSNQDKRSQYLFLTPYGQELCTRLVRDSLDMEGYLLAGFDREERSMFTTCLRKIGYNAVPSEFEYLAPAKEQTAAFSNFESQK